MIDAAHEWVTGKLTETSSHKGPFTITEVVITTLAHPVVFPVRVIFDHNRIMCGCNSSRVVSYLKGEPAPTVQYATLTEENDHEGETWHFYIPLDTNKVALERLASAIEPESDDDERWVDYDLNLAEPVAERDVDVLVKHADAGYWPNHVKLSGVLDIDTILERIALDATPLYKGSIQDYMIDDPSITSDAPSAS